MTIATLDQYYGAGRRSVLYRKLNSQVAVAGQPFSLLDVAGVGTTGTFAIGNTTNGVLVTDATLGYPDIQPFAPGARGQLASAFFRSSVPGGCTLYDRIYNVGSFPFTALQTFNIAAQPSIAARVPDLNYNALELLLEISTTVGAAAVTVQVGYTNQAGLSGRLSQVSGSLSGVGVRRVIPLGLNGTDTGIQRIDSVIIGGATAAGGVNVILARRLADFDIRVGNAMDAQGWDMTGAPFILDSAALWPVITPDGATTGLPSLLMNVLDG